MLGDSPELWSVRYPSCLCGIIRPWRWIEDSCANGPQLQWFPTAMRFSAFLLGTSALTSCNWGQTRSAFNWMTFIQAVARCMDYQRAFLVNFLLCFHAHCLDSCLMMCLSVAERCACEFRTYLFFFVCLWRVAMAKSRHLGERLPSVGESPQGSHGDHVGKSLIVYELFFLLKLESGRSSP